MFQLLISLTTEGWKAEATAEQPTDFESGSPELFGL